MLFKEKLGEKNKRMISSKREQKICEKYSSRDETNRVHCSECPLVKGNPKAYDFRCKANSHYGRRKKDWEYDE